MVSVSVGLKDAFSVNVHRVPSEIFETLVDRHDLEVKTHTATKVATIKMGMNSITFYSWEGDNDVLDESETDMTIANILGISLEELRKEEEKDV